MNELLAFLMSIPIFCFIVTWWWRFGCWCWRNGRGAQQKVVKMRDAAVAAMKE